MKICHIVRWFWLAALAALFLAGAVSAETVTLIAAGDPVRAIVPTDSSLEAVWYTPSYAPDGNWTNGTTGVGYDNPFSGLYLPLIGTDINAQINGINGSFYMRQSFVLASTSGISALTLQIKYDDGFVAYLNGTKVKAVNAPEPLAWDSLSAGGNEASAFVTYDLSAYRGLLQAGTNVLAIQGLNRDLGSSDLLILPELIAEILQNYFQVASTVPANGAQLSSAPTQMTVDFDAAVNASTVAATDFKIDGTSATGYTVMDSDSVQFNLLGGLGSGGHSVMIAEGSIASTTGDLLAAYAGTFSIVTLPTIINLPATDLTADEAVLRARVTDAGGDYPDVLFAWGDEDGGINPAAWDEVVGAGSSGSDEFFAELSNLSPETTYSYRALAVNGAGTNWAASTATFATPAVSLPTIGNLWSSDVSGIEAKLNGELTGTGGEPPEVHMVWGDDNPGTNPGTWDHDVNLGVRGVSEFYTYISGLVTNTTYHFAVYADNSVGRAWKTADPFTTPDLSLVITEFMAANDTILTDGFGTYSDWIEIYNPLDSAQDLTGWYLTDNVGNLIKWQFPSKTIGAGEYLIVFASGLDTTDPSGYLHTSFSLSAGGEDLLLVRPNGTTVASEYAYLQQYADISYGLSPDQTQIRYFETPTPGAANNEDYWDLVKDTKFSVDRGFFTNAFVVAITTETVNATIRYTTDGSRPTETHGTVYSAPIPISKTTVLRAFGYLSGFESSDVDAQTYIFIDNIVNQPSDPEGWPTTITYWQWDKEYLELGHWETVTANWGVNKYQASEAELRAALTNSLTVSLSTDMDVLFDLDTGLFGQPKPLIAMDHPVSVEIFDAVGGENIQLNAAARMMGTVSGYPDKTKPNLRLLFKSEFIDPTSGETFRGPGKLEFPVFEDTEVTTFNTLPLRGMLQGGLVGGNGTAIKDAYVHRRFQDMGYNTGVHCRYVNVYINGLYMGVSQIQERPDDSYMEEYFGGVRDDYDIKKTIISGVDIGLPDAWNALQALVPFPTGTLSPTDYQTLKDDYIDLERYADYMLLEMFIANPDWPSKNFYWNCRRGDPAYGPPDLKWIPFTWDADFAIQTKFLANDLFVPFVEDFRIKSPLGRIWNNLYNNTAWRRFFGDRVHKYLFNGGELSVARLNSSWLELRDELSLLVAGEICRWSTVTPTQWDAGVVAYTTDFWTPRHANCLSQLRSHGFYPSIDAPVYSQHGGVVPKNYGLTMTNPNGSGTIWYTTDDTDPRDSGTAVQYTGSPVTISSTTRVKACVDSGSEWSAMNDAVFQVMPTLIVSEIMYNPIGTGPYAAQEYEFIELHNTGTASVDLSPVRLTKGVEFSFAGSAVTSLPAGGYVVVVKNPAAFADRYNTSGMLIAGAYTNASLNNAGEKITLLEKYNQTVTSFTYDDAWFPATDGAGYSLVHLDSNPATDPNTPDFWEVSPDYLGSPGAADQDVEVTHILINEVLTHTDWPQVDTIELYNPTNVPVDLGGWWLTDNDATFKKFEIPAGTTIPANGYLVIEEDTDGNTNTVPPAAYFGSAFSLSSLGEEVYLSSPTRRWVHGFRFGASANGVSFGRYVTSDGAEHFPAQQSLTLGTANAGPLVGPLVFTEMMTSPPVGKPEYLEVRNISDTSIKLYDELHPENTWLFTDGIGFIFPTGVTLQPGQYLLLASTNETAFRAAWNANSEAAVFGPYSGRLENAGEELELAWPDTPNLDGTVPLIVGERVDYQTNSPPWPSGTDGTGAALERISETAYTDDPANWRASNVAGSPGDAPQVDSDGDDLPDNWEMTHFGQLDHSLGGPTQDADEDGLTNWQEYILGTDPRVANDGLLLRILSGNGAVELEFDSIHPWGQSGYYGLERFYNIQQRVPGAVSEWDLLPGATNLPATGAAIIRTNLPARPANWYRVRATLE